MKMDHIKVPVKTYKGYGISVDFTDTIPDMFKKIQVNVVANGMINAQRIPSLLWRYCALISRTDNLQANSLLRPKSANISFTNLRGDRMEDSGV
jgi:hypothetical protein